MRWVLLLGLAAALRVLLLVYGEWQDANMALKYTDIDYVVFTDAAQFMHAGGSPFERATYRYTPVLAWMLQPNIWLHPAFGKALFVLGDMVVGWIIYSICRERGIDEATAVAYTSSWYEPVVYFPLQRTNNLLLWYPGCSTRSASMFRRAAMPRQSSAHLLSAGFTCSSNVGLSSLGSFMVSLSTSSFTPSYMPRLWLCSSTTAILARGIARGGRWRSCSIGSVCSLH